MFGFIVLSAHRIKQRPCKLLGIKEMIVCLKVIALTNLISTISENIILAIYY